MTGNKRNEEMDLNPYGGDWLEVDGSCLPSNQLPLLRGMLGRRLTNIQRSIPAWRDKERINNQDFFRKSNGLIIFELEGMPPIYFNSFKYDVHEISIDISLDPPELGGEKVGWIRRYTLYDQEGIDDCLRNLISQHILRMKILIRRPHLRRDKAQALQDGIEITFDNGTTIIISYFLNEYQNRLLQILYPEEIVWHAVEYMVDVAKGRIPWRYRFNRWKWRALDRLGRRLGLE